MKYLNNMKGAYEVNNKKLHFLKEILGIIEQKH